MTYEYFFLKIFLVFVINIRLDYHGSRDFSLLHSDHTGSGVHPVSYELGTGGKTAGP
jgi:hypothetical protein